MLFADLETYSNIDIKVAALDRYASDPSTEILMCADGTFRHRPVIQRSGGR